jgi:hypothetical protein
MWLNETVPKVIEIFEMPTERYLKMRQNVLKKQLLLPWHKRNGA